MALRYLCLFALTASVWSLSGAPAAAQDHDQAYAQGVQAYFNGSSRAEGLLTQALANNPNDVRAYYFRGLSKLRSGRRHEAEEDFRTGAAIEATWAGRPMDIGHALERVQGSGRLMLERIRKETRAGVEASREETHQQRYQQARQRGAQALRTQFRLPLGAISPSASPDELASMVAAQAQAAGDPFADDPIADNAAEPNGNQQAGPAATAPAPATPIKVPDAARGAVSAKQLGGVFSGMFKKLLPGLPTGAPGAGGAPFGGAPPEDDPFGAAPGADPFGAAPGADPFGNEAEPKDTPAAEVEEDPFGAPGEDPFGGPTEEDPFGDAEDPFGGEMGDEDPFS